MMLLTGNDLPANLPSWWALVTVALLAGFLTREMLALASWRKGGGTKGVADVGAALAVIIVITVPSAASEAMSSLNNGVAGMWCMGALAFGLLSLQERANYFYHFGCGAAVALGICAKHSTFIYLAPFVLLAGFWFIRQRSIASLCKLGLITLAIVCALNSGWMWRNYRRLGNPLISHEALTANSSRSTTPPQIAANIIRNVSLYTRTPFAPVTVACNTVLEFLSEVIHEPLDDQRWVIEHQKFSFPDKASFSDGSALGNCYSALLLIIAVFGFLRLFKIVSWLGIYTLAVGASFILFSAYLLWDPWHARLEFPYFFFVAPFIAAVLGRWFKVRLITAIAGFLLINAGLSIMGDPTYPAWAATWRTQPRDTLYFSSRPELAPSTIALADDIMQSGQTNVLLRTGSDTWEYPLWVLLKERGFKGTVKHALVEDHPETAAPELLDLPRTVLLTMHANTAHIPERFGSSMSYDTWKAYQKNGLNEERARMINNRAVLRYTFKEAGLLTVHFEPRTATGNSVTNGQFSVAVEWSDVVVVNNATTAFHVGDIFRTNLAIAETTSFSFPVQTPSATIFITNETPANAIDYLSKLDVAEKVRR